MHGVLGIAIRRPKSQSIECHFGPLGRRDWAATDHFLPVFEIVGSSNTITGRTQLPGDDYAIPLERLQERDQLLLGSLAQLLEFMRNMFSFVLMTIDGILQS